MALAVERRVFWDSRLFYVNDPEANWSCRWNASIQTRLLKSPPHFAGRTRVVFYTVCHGVLEVMSHLWIGQTVWRVGLRARHTWRRLDRSRTIWDEERAAVRPPGGLHMQIRMKSFLCSLFSLLLADVLATYHLSAGDPQLIAAQSYAQTRSNGRPPFRTLNPASKFYWNLYQFFNFSEKQLYIVGKSRGWSILFQYQVYYFNISPLMESNYPNILIIFSTVVKYW